MPDRTATPCANRPNCVSTQDERDKFNLAPFILRPGVTIEQVERIALSLPGAVTAEKCPVSPYRMHLQSIPLRR